MKKFILNSLITTLTLSSFSVVLAEETDAQVDVTVEAKTTLPRPNVKPLVEQKKQILMETKDRMREAKDIKASTTKAIMLEKNDKLQELRNKLASSSMERKDDRMEKRDEKLNERREMIKNRIQERFNKMFLRFGATIERLASINEKIDARIEKVKTNGGNTTEAEGYSAEAKHHLAEAKSALDLLKVAATSNIEIDAQIQASTTSSIPTKDTLNNMKMVVTEVEKHMREAHESLIMAVKSLKGNSSSVNVNSKTDTTN